MTLSPLLAQLGNFINPRIPPLPEPPLLHRFVFEEPALPAAALLLAGVIALFAFRSTGATRKGVITLASAAAIALLLIAAGALVQTDRERLLVLQDRLVNAVAGAKIDELDKLLATDARVRSTNLSMLREGLDRERIIATVRTTLGERYKVETVGFIERQAVIDGPNAARTQVYLRVATESSGQTWTWFLTAWRLDPDGRWRAVQIEPLFISGVLPYRG